MQIVSAVILGIVQGLTEFLPVSSSGHLVLAEHFLGVATDTDITFESLLHFATIAAVLLYFWRDIIRLRVKDAPVFIVGSIPAAVAGIFFKDFFVSLFSHPLLVAIALLGTGCINLAIDRRIEQKNSSGRSAPALKGAAIIGIFQAVAIIPGISRSGSTVLGGLMEGLEKREAFTFSFLLSIPAVLGASLLPFLKSETQLSATVFSLPYLAGMFSAFVVGLLALRFFRLLLDKAHFEWFAYYCFVLGGCSALYFLLS